MNSNSQETLRRIEQNGAEFTELQMGYSDYAGVFKSSDASDYSILGAAIGNNNHLEELIVNLDIDDDEEDSLNASSNEFFDGLKRNSSINKLTFDCYVNQTLAGGVGHELLKSYQRNNNNLTYLCITDAVLDNGGGGAITEALRWCTNLKSINISDNHIIDEQLLPMVEAIKEGCNTSLQVLSLHGNRIGNAGCHAIATLLEDPNSNIKILQLSSNQIGNEGATAIANSLANNTKLEVLYLEGNPFDPSAVGIFCTVLCNTSSVTGTYHSNHTLKKLVLSEEQEEQHANLLSSILDLNWGENKSHVVIKKILKYHPNIDMKPLFKWDAKEDGEQSLKALPYVVDWFERAKEAVADEDSSDSDDEDTDNEDNDNSVSDDYDYCVDERKLSAIFQFAKAMPLLLEPVSRIKVDDQRNNKRKRAKK